MKLVESFDPAEEKCAELLCAIDESWAYESKIEDLDEVTMDTIARIETTER